MAIYVYNTKQQELNSKKLAELISFSSNDFSGLISNIQDPIIIENGKWSWNTSLQETLVDFIGGGVDIGYDVPVNENSFSYDCSVYGLLITIPSVNSSPVTNVYDTNRAYIIEAKCDQIEIKDLFITVENPFGNPAQKQYYEYINSEYVLSEDTEVDEEKVYYYKIADSVFSITGAEFDTSTKVSFEYFGNTVWINKPEGRFFIPFCGKIADGEYVSMIFNRDKAGYESFLSARTYYNLLMELGNKFVFRSGGEKLGDIGKLNVTDNKITNTNLDSNYPGVIIDTPRFDNVPTATIDRGIDRLLMINDDTGNIYKTSTNYVVPIKHGGTNAVEKHLARKNLGFYVGTEDPNESGLKPLNTKSTEDINAIYFKIL